MRPTVPGSAAQQRPARHVRGHQTPDDGPPGYPFQPRHTPPPHQALYPRQAPHPRQTPPHRALPPGLPPAPPTTLSLVISRRARREAAARAAQAQQEIDPRIETIEKVFVGVQIAGNVFVLALSLVGWLWLAAHRAGRAEAAGGHVTGTAGRVADSAPASGILGHVMPQSLASASGATLVVIMLATCLLLAPVVNPFYAPPERRWLHTATTAVFGLLAVTTVAVISGAAS